MRPLWITIEELPEVRGRKIAESYEIQQSNQETDNDLHRAPHQGLNPIVHVSAGHLMSNLPIRLSSRLRLELSVDAMALHGSFHFWLFGLETGSNRWKCIPTEAEGIL